jgi:hypothetical protein
VFSGHTLAAKLFKTFKMTETQEILYLLKEPFWVRPDFWLSIFIGLISTAASILAFFQAKRAKEAAAYAATTVKIQTITIELTELIQKLDKLDYEIEFSTARDFLNEISRKIIRLLAPFKENFDYKTTINTVFETLKKTKISLENVKPMSTKKDIDLELHSVYHAIESQFSELSALIAELIGLFEKRTLKNN